MPTRDSIQLRGEFFRVSLKNIRKGVISLEGTTIQEATMRIGDGGNLLNRRNVYTAEFQPCGQTVDTIAAAIKQRVRETIEAGVVWEAAPGPEKYNRMTLRKLDSSPTLKDSSPNWMLGLQVNKPNTYPFNPPPLVLKNVDEAELARVFDRNKAEWWTEQKLLGPYDGWSLPGKNVAGSTFTFERSCLLKFRDGTTKKLVWKGSHGNPDDAEMKGAFTVKDSLKLE